MKTTTLYYCIVYDDDKKEYGVSMMVDYDEAYRIDTEYHKKIRNSHSNIIESSKVQSRSDLTKDDDPKGYKYRDDFFVIHGL